MFLIMAGGLGFMVWVEIGEWRKKRHLSLHARMVLLFSCILWVGGAALIGLMEWNNPKSMGGLSVPGKVMAALFQSVSTRTAGMNTIDLAACGPITKLLMSVLQFIGAAPGSTGGGVKVTTFAVLILTMRSVAQGRDDCVIGGHHIESKTVYRALTIIMLGMVAALGSAVVVYYNTSDAVTVIDAIFESCSAFGTVGLSVGVTSQLNTGAKLLYMLVMFMGRVGPVSFAISLTSKPDDNKRKILSRFATTLMRAPSPRPMASMICISLLLISENSSVMIAFSSSSKISWKVFTNIVFIVSLTSFIPIFSPYLIPYRFYRMITL